MFDTSDFQNCLKLAKVKPVYKKGDQQECSSYRPISLLLNISKLIEKLLYNRLYKFLNQNKCLFNYQFGFRNHHSTNHTISITEKIRKALDEGDFAYGVFLDFLKAFDTVNHKILISKLWTLWNQRFATSSFSNLCGKTNPICWNKQVLKCTSNKSWSA